MSPNDEIRMTKDEGNPKGAENSCARIGRSLWSARVFRRFLWEECAATGVHPSCQPKSGGIRGAEQHKVPTPRCLHSKRFARFAGRILSCAHRTCSRLILLSFLFFPLSRSVSTISFCANECFCHGRGGVHRVDLHRAV